MSPDMAARAARNAIDADTVKYEMALAHFTNAMDLIYQHKGMDGVQRAINRGLERIGQVHPQGLDGWIR